MRCRKFGLTGCEVSTPCCKCSGCGRCEAQGIAIREWLENVMRP